MIASDNYLHSLAVSNSRDRMEFWEFRGRKLISNKVPGTLWTRHVMDAQVPLGAALATALDKVMQIW